MKRTAFSLVELSIVLVILGLLVGGILAGQSLIRASELRSVGADFTRFQTATLAFRDKYFALPGDMATATSFWGAAHSTASTCRGTASTGGLTCNGNGDGQIYTIDGVTNSEWWHYWVQLADAGLIEGAYSGVQDGSGTTYLKKATPGVNVPASKMSGGYTALYAEPWLPSASQSKNVLMLGTPYGNSYTSGAIMTGAEAWNIDTKIDDGRNASGRIMSTYGSGVCLDANGYILNNTTKDCNLLWVLQ